MAEGVEFEPTLGFPLSLISSQVPSTTQPPFLRLVKSRFLILRISVFRAAPLIYMRQRRSIQSSRITLPDYAVVNLVCHMQSGTLLWLVPCPRQADLEVRKNGPG